MHRELARIRLFVAQPHRFVRHQRVRGFVDVGHSCSSCIVIVVL